MGKNYQALVEMFEQLEMKMRNLKTTTRFLNSVRAVFDTLIDDFKAVVRCLENIASSDDTGSEAQKRIADAKAIKRKILVLQLSGTSDLYENFGYVANLCQEVEILPHERLDNVMSAASNFDAMLNCLDHAQCTQLHESGEMVALNCWWPRYHGCLKSLKSGKFMGVEIKNEHEEKAYFTKLAKN